MNFARKFRDLIDHLQQNWWIKVIFGLLAFGANYLQYRDGGATNIFWAFLALTILVILLVIGIPLAQKWYHQQKIKWIESTKTEISQAQKVEVLKDLLLDFENIEKAKELSNALKSRRNVHALAILPIEHQVGVILNIGSRENVKTGTKLILYRNDAFTANGDRIENQLAVIEITYVQANNNCSQAIVTQAIDKNYWDSIRKQLNSKSNITPPSNFVIPYEIPELSSLTISDIQTFRQYLEAIQTTLILQATSASIEKEK